MNKSLALFILLMVSACSTGMRLPPESPSLVQIAAINTSLNTSGLTPPALIDIGTVLDDQGCYNWLDQQISTSQQVSLGQSFLGLGGAGAAIAGGPQAAAAAGGLGLVSALLGASQTNSPLGADPVAASVLVYNMRQAWRNAASVPGSLSSAYVFLDAYHQLCSLGRIRAAMVQAIITAPVVTVPPPPPSPVPVPRPPVPVPPPPVPVPPPPVPAPLPGPVVTPLQRVVSPPIICVGVGCLK